MSLIDKKQILEKNLKADYKGGQEEVPQQNGSFSSIKNILHKYPRLYRILVKLLAPAYCGISPLKICQQQPEGFSILNVGSGVTNYTDNCVNLDKRLLKNVDVVSRIENMPFIENSFDVVISISSLNEVDSIDQSLHEISRVLKDDGYFYCFFPFMQGVLNSDDKYRLTDNGLRSVLSERYDIIYLYAVGLASSLNWILQNFLSSTFSFGSKKLYSLLSILFLVLLSPIKILDIALNRIRSNNMIPNGYMVICRNKK